jgi:integrase
MAAGAPLQFNRLFSPVQSFFCPCGPHLLPVNLKDLSDQEKSRILDSVGGTDRILLLLLFETGLEAEELLSLKTADLDLERGELLLHSGERVQLSPFLKNELGVYLRSRPALTYLLEGRCGKPMTVKWKRCVLEKLLSRR